LSSVVCEVVIDFLRGSLDREVRFPGIL
jgi:hypothetical protein